MSSGEWICFLDADDGWFPGKLAAQLEYLARHPEVGAVTHAWIDRHPEADGHFAPLDWQAPASPLALDPQRSGWIYPRLLLGYIMQTSTVMLRRETARLVGFFNPDLVAGEDFDYWLRLSSVTRIDCLAAAYSFYRREAGGNLSDVTRAVDYGYELVHAARDRWGLDAPDGHTLPAAQYRHRLGHLAFDFAYGHYHHGSPTLARRSAWKAFRHGYRRGKSLLYCLAALGKEISGR